GSIGYFSQRASRAGVSRGRKFKQFKVQVNRRAGIRFSDDGGHASLGCMRWIFLSLILFFAATSIAAAAPSLAAREGQWVCLPDDDTAPQVLGDFEENIYRRCDQYSCSQYDILGVRQLPEATEVAFASGAILSADDDGGRYTETLDFGDTAISASGTCSFRGDDSGIFVKPD
ncbi:MAG: hypothetical protein O3C49_08425, partial [Proteobacteria bacterium]|nr:hypothetical protein [Pseudomonadota bacterium]